MTFPLLGDHLLLAGRYVGVSVRAQLQYRASFVMLAVGQLLATGLEFLGIVVLFQRFGSLRGWTLPEVALLYGMVNVSFAIAEAMGRGFDVFPGMVKMGEFDRLLLRPRSTAFQVAVQELQLMRIGRLAQGAGVMIWATVALHAAWTPAACLAVAGGIATGAAIFYGLFVIQATIAFWTIESLEIMNTVTYGGTEAAQYPLSIYRVWMRRLFTLVVPLACANFLPAGYVLARPDAASGAVVALCPLVGAAFLTASLWFWRFGEKHYLSTGS